MNKKTYFGALTAAVGAVLSELEAGAELAAGADVEAGDGAVLPQAVSVQKVIRVARDIANGRFQFMVCSSRL